MIDLKVCIICEGCYPYVYGGVSSWIQMLMEKFSDIEFIILTIATSRKDVSGYKYKIPSNVVQIKEIFMSELEKHTSRKYSRLNKEDKETLRNLIINDVDAIDWCKTIALLIKLRSSWASLLMGPDFYDIVVELYGKKYLNTPFSHLLWTLRSMFMPLIASVIPDIPEADVYHSVSTGYAGVLGSMAKTLYGKPFLLTEHGIYTREREEEIIKSDWVKGIFKDIWIDQFYKFSRLAYNTADRVVSLFESNKGVQVELGCPVEKIEVIHNGVDVTEFLSLPQKTPEEESNINIGSVARVVPIKDIKTMLLAFGATKEAVPNARLWIIGPTEEDPAYYEECLSLVQSIGLKDVTFTGYANVKDYLGRMDIMLLTSISEGQPLAVLEAMASKKPQVCTNVGACKEMLLGDGSDRFGPAGFICPIMNVAQLSGALIQLCTDRNLREQMGEAGYQRVQKYYKKDDFTNQYYKMYKLYGGE